MQIYRRLYHARKNTERFTELKENTINVNDLPGVLRISLSVRPALYSSVELAKKYTYQPRIGAGIGKMLTTNGGVRNPNNLYAAAAGLLIAGGVVAIKGRSNNSKLKRVLEEGRGSLINYNVSMNTTVEELKKMHAQIVTFSNRLKQTEVRLIELISKLEQIPAHYTKLEEVGPESTLELKQLYFITMEAINYSKIKI